MIKIRESSYNEYFQDSSLIVDWMDNTSEKDFRIMRVQKAVPEESLYHEFVGEFEILGTKYPKDIKGIETHSHVTVAIGLHENELGRTRQVLELVAKNVSPRLTLGRIKSFRNTDRPFDVLYLEIKSLFLEFLNATLRKQLEYINNEFTYKPHICIAYIQKESCKDLEGKAIDGSTGDSVIIKSIDYILPTKNKYTLKV